MLILALSSGYEHAAAIDKACLRDPLLLCQIWWNIWHHSFVIEFVLNPQVILEGAMFGKGSIIAAARECATCRPSLRMHMSNMVPVSTCIIINLIGLASMLTSLCVVPLVYL